MDEMNLLLFLLVFVVLLALIASLFSMINTSYKLNNGVICKSHYDNGSFGDCSDGLIHYNNNAIAINNNNPSQGTGDRKSVV